MLVSLIVAMDLNRGIGRTGRLPWRLRADLQNFKARTLGHHILMGRKTYETIRRPLPDRKMIVITRNPDYRPENCPEPVCRIASSLEQGLEMARDAGETEAFVIGGAEIFALAIPYAQRVYLTHVETQDPADVFFPPLDLTGWWQVESFRQSADEHNQFPFTFVLYERMEKEL